MSQTKTRRRKTDKRDAENIARCLASGTYSEIHIPTDEDNAVKEYIRMRDDAKDTLKRTKQRLLSFCTRNGMFFDGGKSYWTQKHIAWLKKLDFGNAILQETYQELYALYTQISDKVALFDKRIEELAQGDKYADDVKKLSCLNGIGTHTALATIAEIGDFHRFEKASHFAAYLGLAPGEDSSGTSIRRTGITKEGNSHIRRLLVEAANCYSRGTLGTKSKALKARQAGMDPKFIAYVDKANDRLKRKFYRILFHSKRNIATVAVARELACFIWGIMTGNTA